MTGYVKGVLDLVGMLEVSLYKEEVWSSNDAYKAVLETALSTLERRATQLELNLEKGEQGEG